MGKKIFVAGPFNHSDKNIEYLRVLKIKEYCLKQFLIGNAPISPLIMGLSIAEVGALPTDTNTWRVFSETLLKGCDELHVLMLPEYEKSSGVKSEIDMGIKLNIPIVYVIIDF